MEERGRPLTYKEAMELQRKKNEYERQREQEALRQAQIAKKAGVKPKLGENE